jgi:hypothetical protein
LANENDNNADNSETDINLKMFFIINFLCLFFRKANILGKLEQY